MCGRSPSIRPLALFGLLCLLLTALPPLAGWLLAGDPSRFDRFLLLLRDPSDPARPIGGVLLTQLFRFASTAGGFPSVALLTLVFAVGLALRGRGREAVLLALAVTGTALSNAFLKLLFARPRPAIVPPLVEAEGWSFPSGHAALSAALGLTAAEFLRPTASRASGHLLHLTAFAFLLLVGTSRIVLAVHYPSDVAAGWLLGTLWATMAAASARAPSCGRNHIGRP